MLWSWSSIKRVRYCGRVRINGGHGVPLVDGGEGVAHFSNLQTCGSIHACPSCSAKIRHRRGEEIDQAVTRHLARGGRAMFVTLTVPHDVGDRLSPMLDAVAGGFRSILSGRKAKAERKRYGIVGTIRSLEITYGSSGWHPHLHVLVLLDECGSLLDDHCDERALAEAWGERWRRWCVGQGYRRPSDEHGVTWSMVHDAEGIASYVAKVQDDDGTERSNRRLSMELARADLKEGRRKGRTPFQLLRQIRDLGDADLLGLWWEFEEATRGRQVITWSRGLRAALLDEVEASDDEIASAEVGGTPVAVVPMATWNALCTRRGGTLAVLVGYEASGLLGVREALVRYGLDPHLDPPPEPPG